MQSILKLHAPPPKNNLPDNRHVETQILMVQLETTLAHLCLKTAKHNKWVKLKPIVRAIASPPVCTFSAEHPFVRCTFLNKQCYWVTYSMKQKSWGGVWLQSGLQTITFTEGMEELQTVSFKERRTMKPIIVGLSCAILDNRFKLYLYTTHIFHLYITTIIFTSIKNYRFFFLCTSKLCD